MIEIEAQVKEALRSPNPRARLARLMGDLLEHGLERDEIFTALETLRAKLHAAGRLEDEDLLLEAIDGFSGWCST